MIQLTDVYKSFGPLIHPLRGLSLEARQGETMTVLGLSGSGKSVLLKAIIGLIEPDRGSILVDDVEVIGADHATLQSIRRKVGYVFQQGALYDSLTVGENLAFPLEKVLGLSEHEIRPRVAEYLEHVGLPEKVNTMPAELSGGQRKRIGVARTIITEPNYLLYDEPTTGLDPKTAKEISLLIVELQKKLKITSIVVTHDPYCLNIVADRVGLLEDGRLSFVGTKSEARRSNNDFLLEFFSPEVVSEHMGEGMNIEARADKDASGEPHG